MTLHLYCPPNTQSKAYLVIDNVRKGWSETIDIKNYARTDGPSLFWGFVGENFALIKDLERRGKDYYFADMPYFGRWNGDNNFMPVVGNTKVIVQGLLDTYDALFPSFKKIS